MTGQYRNAILAAVLSLFCLSAVSVPGAAAELRAFVTGLRSARGTMRYALYNRARGFATTEGRFAFQDIPVTSLDGTTAVFADLPPGRYAVAVYHDENDNDDFDTNFIGMPLEGFGFSRDPTVFLSAPGFADCAIEIGPEDRAVTIHLKY